MANKKITILYDGDLGERLKESAKRNMRSLNKQAQYFLEECLTIDEKYHSLDAEKKAFLKELISKL